MFKWVVARSKDLCAQKGLAAPVVHDFEFRKEAINAQAIQIGASAKQGVSPFTFGFVIGIAGFGAWPRHGRIAHDARNRVIRWICLRREAGSPWTADDCFRTISLLLYQAWWAASLVAVAALAVRVWRASRHSESTLEHRHDR